MSDDLLSQNEVDNLLNSAGAGDEASSSENQSDAAADQNASDEGQDAQGVNFRHLSEAFDLFGEKAKSVLSTVLNRQIAFSVDECKEADGARVAEQLDGELLSVNVPLTGGLEGTLVVVFTKKDVAVLSDLMMLGDGSAAYTDDHKDAISELVNQVTGAFVSSINEKLPESASAGTIGVEEFSLAQPGIDMGSSNMGLLKMTVEGIGDSYVALLCSTEMSQVLTSVTSGGEEDDGLGLTDDDDEGGIGLSDDEMNDLAGVVSNLPSSNGSFSETSLALQNGLNAPKENVEMLLDVELDVSIELGKANLSIKRILDLAPGAVVELDRMAGEPVDLVVNGKVVARGEVVVVDENFGIRIVSLVSAEDRIRSLQ